MKRLAVLGFGNRLWRDDGAGSVLAQWLKEACPDLAVFDGGMVPENFLEKVAAVDPDRVLLIDSGDFGGAPGAYRVLGGQHISSTGFSTHAGSPRMLSSYLVLRTGAVVDVLVIQPGDTSAGCGLSKVVEATVRELTAQLAAPGGLWALVQSSAVKSQSVSGGEQCDQNCRKAKC